MWELRGIWCGWTSWNPFAGFWSLPLNERLSTIILFVQCAILAVQLWLIYRQLTVSRDAEARAQRHDRLSVRPYLDFATQSERGSLRAVLSNHGNGVAIIGAFTFTVDGKEILGPTGTGQLREFLEALGLAEDGLDPRFTSRANWIATPAGLRSGGEIVVLDVRLRASFNVDALRSRIVMKVRYKSLYDEEFEQLCNWQPSSARVAGLDRPL
jgi:hypothetical protein